jgi:hypothetical protein
MARQRLFGVICLRLRALGLQLTNRLPLPGDYPSNCLRGCPERCLVLRLEGSLGRNLLRNLDCYSPRNLLCCLTANVDRSLPTSRPGCIPVYLFRTRSDNSARYLHRSSARNLRSNLQRCPLDRERCLGRNMLRGEVKGRC